jgi:hypothetical protein
MKPASTVPASIPAPRSSPKSTRIATGALLAAIVLGGCGGGDDGKTRADGSGSTETTAVNDDLTRAGGGDCLVNLDEVAAALPDGTEPEQVDVAVHPGDFTLCEFRWEKFKQGTLEVRDYKGTANSLEASAPRQDTAIDVGGLGDRAYAQGTERSVELRVFTGDSAVVIGITQFPPNQNIAPRLVEWKGDALAAATELAKAAERRQGR